MSNTEKMKILILSDSPYATSGVGTQTKYMIEGLLDTGKYKFMCLAGALKHKSYQPIITEKYGEDFTVIPVDGYGSPDIVRSMIYTYRPDALWMMTDPRYWEWLWNIENEIRPHVPMVYYHVWDNYPYPTYNKDSYNSNDMICTISKVTDDIVKTVAPDVLSKRIPHTVDSSVFKKLDPEELNHIYETSPSLKDKLVFFWNNRNARRKQPGSLIWWFKEFLDEVGHDKAALIMHTDPRDQNGPDLESILKQLDLVDEQVIISVNKMPPEGLACLYNVADCTINIADAEGFGLSTLESLSCETPIIVSMTGGLQEQVTDGSDWFGIGIEPSSRSIIGSQEIPFIYEDRISKEDFLNALRNFYNMSQEERASMGVKGRSYVEKEYSLDAYVKNWDKAFSEVREAFGSWDSRRGYENYTLEAV